MGERWTEEEVATEDLRRLRADRQRGITELGTEGYYDAILKAENVLNSVPIDLDTVRRFKSGDGARTDQAAEEATLALRRLVASMRRAPLRAEHKQTIEALFADFANANQ